MGLIWAARSISRSAPIFYLTLLLFGPPDMLQDWLVLDGRPRSIFTSLLNTTLYFIRPISS